ncbi:MAG: stage II sporulation protein M [Verrucomicrobiota bacterium]
MNRKSFEERGGPQWAEFELMLGQLEDKKAPSPEEPEKIPSLFRQVCSDLALAEHRVYGRHLTDRLNEIVIRGYNLIYRPSLPLFEGVMKFFGHTFPRAVRAQAKLFWFNMLLFWGGFIAMVLSVEFDPVWVQALLGAEQMEMMENMYNERGPQEALRERFGSDFLMFCFYVYNNIGIDFMTFAGGILAGVGSCFFMIFNGLFIGAATGYVHYACRPDTFYSFVAGHSSFELIAAVISGTAGMVLGMAILRPGRKTRRQAIADAGRTALPLILGAASMTFVAAIIEGFWSAQPLVPELKYFVGILFWALVTVYLLFAGRRGAYQS